MCQDKCTQGRWVPEKILRGREGGWREYAVWQAKKVLDGGKPWAKPPRLWVSDTLAKGLLQGDITEDPKPETVRTSLSRFVNECQEIAGVMPVV
eukprot:831250-Heterocapsa_arctica.AAC.1